MSYKHILVAVDLSQPSDQVIARAVSLAKNIDAKLSFVSVDIHHLDPELYEFDPEEMRYIEKDYDKAVAKLDEITSVISYPIEKKLVLMGEVEEQIIESVTGLEVDLLVSGHHHGFWNRWWSSARKLVNMTPVDLLLIHI